MVLMIFYFMVVKHCVLTYIIICAYTLGYSGEEVSIHDFPSSNLVLLERSPDKRLVMISGIYHGL